MHAVSIDQRLNRLVIPLRLDAHEFSKKHANSLPHLLIVGDTNIGFAISRELFDRARNFVGNVVRDQLAIAFVVFFNCVALWDAPQLLKWSETSDRDTARPAGDREW